MNAQLKAVLPAAVRRRWDAIALAQLAERAAQLDAENDELKCRLAHAEQVADDCWQQAMDMQLQLCERTGSEPGITQDGQLVVTSARSST